jgi:glucose-6-phosphate isomerase
MREFTDQVHQGHLRGSTGKPFKDIVVIGIGGSYLGTAFVSEALHAWADHGLSLRFLSNVDIHDFGRIVSEIDVERTLWVVISKSYTTAETLANTNQVKAYLHANGLDPGQHLVTVTSKGSPGDSQDEPVLEAFHMFDFIGGRYSVTSAVGGVPLSLLLGYDRFERFLKGAAEMDQHAAKAPTSQNLPLLAAMIGIWNYYFLGYPAQAIIPYAAPLKKLPAHIQQLYMESIGKAVDQQGNPLPEPAGVIVFGEPGTNAQHSFFQLAHQGRPFPIDFIGVVKPQYDQYHAQTNGVTNHQELWANMLSQSLALAVGRDDPNPAKQFSGNRPSSILLLNDLQPESIGALLAFYEAKTVYEAFALGINAFDQFGVELGKTIASGIRKSIAAQNAQPGYDLEQAEAMPRFYLDILARGSF